MIFNVINPEELRVFLGQLEQDFALPSGLAVQALERPLLRRRACLKELRRFPQNAPAWLTRERHAKEKFYRFSKDKLLGNDRLRCDVLIVLEWLKQSVAERVNWLDARTPDGRYRKLVNLGRLEHLIRAIRKGEAKCVRPTENHDPTTTEGLVQRVQIETVLILEVGWRWVRLLNEQAFIQEGVLMHNCLGSPSEHVRLITDRSLYSLRDPKNRPFINVSIVQGQMSQCRGRRNSVPAARYHGAIEQLLRAFGWSRRFRIVRHNHDLTDDSPVTAAFDGETKFVSGACIDGSLQLFDDPLLFVVPSNLIVAFNILIARCDALRSLSAGHTIGRNLSINCCEQLSVIEGHLRVGGNLTIEACRIRTIRGPLHVARDFRLVGAVSLTEFEGPITVDGDVSLVGTIYLTALPAGTTIGGNLDIRMSGIRTWPRDIHVGGSVIVSSKTQADQVPKKLKVILQPHRSGAGFDPA